MPYAMKKRQQLAPLWDSMQRIVDKAKGEKRGLTPSESERFDGLKAEEEGLMNLINAEEHMTDIDRPEPRATRAGRISETGMEEIRDTYRLPKAEARERERNPAERAFSNYLRGGMDRLDDDDRTLMMGACLDPGGTARMNNFRNAMSTTTGSQGGFTVPQGFSQRLEQAKRWFGGISGTVGKFETENGAPWPWPTVNDTANCGRIIGQNQQVVQTDPQFDQVNFGAYIGSSDLVLVPLALTQDSYFDFDGLIADLLGKRLGRLYNVKCTVGTGVNEPTGIVPAAVASGNIRQFVTGLSAGISYDELVNIEHLVDPAYRYNPSTYWMFSDAMLKLLKKLVDSTGRPLWQPGLTASFREGAAGVDVVASRPTILDHPYITNPDMAGPTAGNNSILFGDLDNFKVREVVPGTTVLRLTERYADYLQVGFIAYQRFDSNLIDAGTHPIAVGRQAAS